jgi:hypothetical protein
MTVGAQRGAHGIKLCEINGVSIYNQVSSRLEVGSRVSFFIVDKFGDPNLQQPESQEIIGPGIGCLPPAPT